MQTIRTPAVAGLFYPADPCELRDQVRYLLDQVEPSSIQFLPKAIIAPHAGYLYSGPIAASVYARLQPLRGVVTRVVLLGPSHRVGFRGLAASAATAFATPLGQIPVDQKALTLAREFPDISVLEQAHAREHSLEVHLPFLQEVFGDFELMPLVVGEARPQQVGTALEAFWGGPETLIVISSDLSHYLEYQRAQQIDQATSQAIEALRFEEIGYEQACGRNPINGLLWLARNKRLHAETIDLRNSGDTAGSRDQVVGYGAYAFH